MVATGVEGFDGLLPGGIPPTAAVVVQGPQGPEKYAFAHQFLAEGLAGGEGALAVITRTSPEDFFAELRALGVDVDAHLQAGSLVVVDWYTYKSRRVDAVEEGRSIVRSSASLVNLEIAFVDGMKKLHGFPAKRCVVDLLSPAIKLFGPTLTYDLTGSLRTRLKGAGFTALFVLENSMHDDTVISSVHGAFDGVVDFRRVEADGRFTLEVAVLFMAGLGVQTRYADVSVAGGRLLIAAPPPPPPAQVLCPVCGTNVGLDAKACPQCGTEFVAEAPAAPEVVSRLGAVTRRARTGLTNGLAGGKVNGLARTAPGRVNGMTNGLVNGLRRTRHGLTNGLTNGTGLTNGLGARHYARHGRRSRWKVYLIPLVSVLLLAAPLFGPGPSFAPEAGAISIDGAFGDWAAYGTRAVPMGNDASLPQDVDILEATTVLRDGQLSLLVRVEGNVLAGSVDTGGQRRDVVRAFLDADRSAATGYSIGGLGADYLIQVEGQGGAAARAVFQRFPAGDPLNWSAWTFAGWARAAASGPNLEVQVDWEALGLDGAVDVLVQAQRDTGAEDLAFPALTTEAVVLVASQLWIGAVSVSGAGQPLARVDLTARLGDASVSLLRFHLEGTYQDGDATGFLLTAGATSVPGVASAGTVTFSFPTPLLVPRDATTTVTVSAGFPAGNGHTLGLSLLGESDVALAEGVATVVTEPSANRFSYIGPPPSSPVVDGGFAEWQEIPDIPGADDDPRGRNGLDLIAFNATAFAGQAFLYARGGDVLLAGDPAPEATPRVPGVSSAPPAQAGTPTPPPRVRGIDVLRAYLDTDNLPGGGYYIGGIRADYLVEVSGRDGRPSDVPRLLRWQGGWVPESGSAVDVMLDRMRLELSASRLGGFPQAFGVFLDLRDWRGAGDGAFAAYGTRGGTRGSGTPDTQGVEEVTPMFTGAASNRFLVTSRSGWQVGPGGAQSYRISYRFTVTREALTPNDIYVYVYNTGSSPGTFEISLQLNSGGNPSGSAECANTFSPGAGAAGWFSPTFAGCGGPYSVGTVLHVVVQCVITCTGSGRWVQMLYTLPHNQLHPYNGASEPNSNVMTTTNSGSTWTVQNWQPVIVVPESGANGGSSEGSSYVDFATVTIDGSNGRGNKFQLQGGGVYNKAEFYVSKTGSPTGTLNVRIYNVDTSTNLVTATVPAATVGALYGWVTWTFADTSLAAFTNYAIWLEPSSGGTDASNYYTTYVSISNATTPYQELTFDGTSTYRTYVTSGPTFSDSVGQDIPFTLVPEFEILALPLGSVLVLFGLGRRARRRLE